MKTMGLLVALVLLPRIVWCGPGVELSANGMCPGIAGATGDGGFPDCAALASAGQYVRLYGTFKVAEVIPDLVALEGRVSMTVYGTLDAPENAFWVGAAGSCLRNHGGSVRVIASKPTNGDPCGNSASIRSVFSGDAEVVALPYDDQRLDYFFTACGTAASVTPAQRVFGFELRFDPAFSAEDGGSCGSCGAPVFFDWATAHPVSQSGLPTTTLTAATGDVLQCGRVAGYNIPVHALPPQPAPPAGFPTMTGCAPVPTRQQTWGLLKSLYR